MGQHTDATIEANEANAREGYVVAAPWGYFLLEATFPAGDPVPILAWRIGRNAECDAVLPVTATGTHSSQCWVLRPDGKIVWHAVSYGSAAPEYETLEGAKNRPSSCPTHLAIVRLGWRTSTPDFSRGDTATIGAPNNARQTPKTSRVGLGWLRKLGSRTATAAARPSGRSTRCAPKPWPALRGRASRAWRPSCTQAWAGSRGTNDRRQPSRKSIGAPPPAWVLLTNVGRAVRRAAVFG